MTDDDHVAATTGRQRGDNSASNTSARHCSPQGDAEEPTMTVLGDDNDAAAVELPTRIPDGVWAWLVTAVDLDPHDEPRLVQGVWVREQPPANFMYSGDLVVRLTTPESGREDMVAVEMLLCYADRWTLVGRWPNLGSDWPQIVAPTAAAVMGLWCDVAEAGAQRLAPAEAP